MDQKIVCPKCNSDQITSNEKGFSAGKAIGAAAFTGGIGLLAGFHGSGKVIITCLACGNRFKAGEGKLVPVNPSQSIKVDQKAKNGFLKCPSCERRCFANHKYCFGCGTELEGIEITQEDDIKYPLSTCEHCGKLAVSVGKFCPYCKGEIKVEAPLAGYVIMGIVALAFVYIVYLLL